MSGGTGLGGGGVRGRVGGGVRVVADDVGFHIAGREVLRGVTVTVAPGEVTAVSGPSGAGKTSLLLVLARAVAPSSGSVRYERVEGHPGGDDGWRAELGLVPQSLALSPALTAQENIALSLTPHVPAAEARRRVTASLEAVGLGPSLASRSVIELSGGQRQRVAVARALALRPSVLIADESTSELDAENQSNVIGLYLALASEGSTVVVSTHDPAVVERATTAYALEDGTLMPAIPAIPAIPAT